MSLTVHQTKGAVQYSGPRKFAVLPPQLALPEGSYDLDFSADGFRTQSAFVDLADAQQKSIAIQLESRR